MIAPIFKLRFAPPSSQRPMPEAHSSSTPQWQNERVLPMGIKFFLLSKVPFTPATALSCRSVSVTAKSSELTLPALKDAATSAGITSTSTLNPASRETLGDSPAPTFPFFCGNSCIQLQCMCPAGCVSKCLKAKCLLSFCRHSFGVIWSWIVTFSNRGVCLDWYKVCTFRKRNWYYNNKNDAQ